jgi:hypothetical protein
MDRPEETGFSGPKSRNVQAADAARDHEALNLGGAFEDRVVRFRGFAVSRGVL